MGKLGETTVSLTAQAHLWVGFVRRIRDLGNEHAKLIVFLSAAHALDLTLILIFTFTLILIYDLCSSVILSVKAVLTDTANSGPDEPAEIALLGFCGIGNKQDSITRDCM